MEDGALFESDLFFYLLKKNRGRQGVLLSPIVD